MIADAMGWKLDRVTDEIAPKIADSKVTSQFLTVENEQQAIVRANPKHANKGGGAAEAALALLELRPKFS